MPELAPLIVTYHSDIVRQRVLLRAYGPLLGRTLRSAARIIATSPNYIASSAYLRPHAAKCAVIPLGIDAERFVYADQRLPTEDGGWRMGDGESSLLHPPSSILHPRPSIPHPLIPN